MDMKANHVAEVRPATFFAVQDYLMLAAAGLSFLGSVALWFSGDREAGQFVGLWVPSIIAFGIYLKIQSLTSGERDHG